VLPLPRPDEGTRVVPESRSSPHRVSAWTPSRCSRSALAAKAVHPAHPALGHLMTLDAVPHRLPSSRHRVKGVRVVRIHPLGQGHPSGPK
jgi:hypothetical protein